MSIVERVREAFLVYLWIEIYDTKICQAVVTNYDKTEVNKLIRKNVRFDKPA